MPKVQNKKTGKVSTVSLENLDKMQALGMMDGFKILADDEPKRSPKAKKDIAGDTTTPDLTNAGNNDSVLGGDAGEIS